MNLNELRDQAYKNAVNHGWHEDDLPDAHWYMLIISELCEAIQADRENKCAGKADYISLIDKYSGDKRLGKSNIRQYQKDLFEDLIKDSIEDELADVVIRCLDFSGLRHIDLSSVFEPTPAMLERTREMLFTVWALEVTHILETHFLTCDCAMGQFLPNIFAMAKVRNIDLEWHIVQKMKYNENRPYKHNKMY